MNVQSQTFLDLPADLWQRDEPLRRAAELIEQSAGRIRAVSFDFFDTIVWRLTAKPTDVFYEVGHRLCQQAALPAHVTKFDYDVFRRIGEAKARERQTLKDKSREDINLAEIYDQLKTMATDPNTAAQIELAAEGELCMLNPVMIEFARHAKERGLKLLIVSDIYLSAEQLRSILRANHLDPALFDFVFTSSDTGVCKWTGNLFKHVLKSTGLKPEELLHIGDNFHADVAGARKAGIRGCHYVLSTPETATILDRENFLLGGQTPCFSVNSLRLLAARNFPGETDEAFFARSGALLLGPLLTRFASWACEQFVAAGVHKVGAFMREGELLGQMLQNEAAATGHALEITPLYVNRKSTDLAAIDELTAASLIDWVGRRQTLKLKTILEHFGLQASELRRLPFSPDEKINSRERLLQVGKFLFAPEIAQRIEKRSAAERRKIMDYLRPWLDSGGVFGVCDIGYNATAQMQLKRVFELEGSRSIMVGCYLVTCEMAARRMLDGLDVRHFLGAFGHPGCNYFAFLRSPAFVEQSLVAGCGTTLGYERTADGEVRPVLDKMRFPPELLRRQRAFKDGILHYQKLWLHCRAQKPGLLDGSTELSRRLLADIDLGCTSILARATAFPTQNEGTRFGSLPLDDYYFAEGFKTISGAKESEFVRTKGYTSALGDQSVLWPQAANLHLNPKAAADFFAYAKTMLLCQPGHDNDGVQLALTVILQASNPEKLRCVLAQLARNSRAEFGREIALLLKDGDKKCAAVADEFVGIIRHLKVFMRPVSQSVLQQLNHAVDSAGAPLLLFIDDSAQLADAWDQAALAPFRADTGAVLATPDAGCLVVRRQALVEALGFAENLSHIGSNWKMLFAMRELRWQIKASRDIVTAAQPQKISSEDRRILTRIFPDFETAAAEITVQVSKENSSRITVDWIGSFLDHGSLSHVNREMAAAFGSCSAIKINRVSNGGQPSAALESLVRDLSASASSDATVTVRHAWPPNWQRPAQGKLVVIQPWEFGSLPQEWVEQSKNVDEFWVPSNYVRKVYTDSGIEPGKVQVVPNGIDPERFHPGATPRKFTTTKSFKFLFVGGTIPRKGIDVLLQAFLKTFTASDDVALIIKDFGGNTIYKGQTWGERIAEIQRRPNAPEIIYLDNELAPEELPGLYTACDCLVHPYRGEGFGLPVIEAMACGLPVIVTAGGATDDFATDEFAYRIPATRRVIGNEISGMKLAAEAWLLEPDANALSEMLKWITTNLEAARAKGRAASEHARRNWTWKRASEIALARLQQLATAPSAMPQPRSTTIELPPVAKIGNLKAARELLSHKKLHEAWETALAAIHARPFHPEAFLLLAEIALAAGDATSARQCAERARHLAPGWDKPKQFLKKPLKGDTKTDWLKLPMVLNSQLSTLNSQLTICLIAKNEEKFLGQCLKSICDLAQQIIVVDTGSTDRTVEIAREHGAEVHSFAWCDDFSAARNAALEHATGDWILLLDADEELPADQHAKLQADLKAEKVIAHRLPLVNHGQNDGQSYVPRLFRNAPGVYFYGRIHEQVFPSLVALGKTWGLDTALGTAQILHHGYTKEVVQDRNKIERNLKLLRQAIEENPSDANLAMNFGLELVRSGDLTGGIEKYREAIRLMSAQKTGEVVPELREVLLTQFTSHLYKACEHDEVVRTLGSPLAKNGGLTASLHFALGLSNFELKNYREAAEQMRQCLAKRNQTALSPINTDIHTCAPNHCLALSLAKLGDRAGAEKAFQAALSETGRIEDVKLDYAKFLANQNRQLDALHKLNEIIAENSRNAAAWRLGGEIALSQPDFLEFARDWTGEATRHLAEDIAITAQRAEVLLLSGDTASAHELWERIYSTEPQPRALAALILCEALEAQTTHAPDEGAQETLTSQAFIAWYKKLLATKTHTVVGRLNDQTEKLSRVLPTAAGIIEKALFEAENPQVSAACA